jgi:hypothetical protein
MMQIFQMPHGIQAIQDASGFVFSPKAGYTVQEVSGQKWSHIYRAACSTDAIARLTQTLVKQCLPPSHYFILSGHWFNDRVDTYLSDFLLNDCIEKVIRQHLENLIHDGMVGFGFAWYDSARHEEIFIDDHKILTILTSQPDLVESILHTNQIHLDDQLEFISQHAHTHLNLGGENADYCHDIVEKLKMNMVA